VNKNVARTRVQVSKKKRNIFLQILGETGQVTKAAESAGYTSPNYLLKLRRDDEEFAEQWADAVKTAEYTLADEAIRRGRDGVLEPVYFKGKVVDYKLVYSDTLLMFILKKLNPSYRDTGRGGETNINFGIAVLPMTAPNEGAWEQRAIDMHAGQTIIELEAKPTENNLTRVKRGD
jgi:hypothetical protein